MDNRFIWIKNCSVRWIPKNPWRYRLAADPHGDVIKHVSFGEVSKLGFSAVVVQGIHVGFVPAL